MPDYAYVESSDIVWRRSYEDVIDEALLQRKGILPVVEDRPVHDSATQVLEGPTTVVESTQVVDRYTVRAKSPDELLNDVRGARKFEYLNLGVDDGDFENTVGDILDAVQKKIRQLDAAIQRLGDTAPEAEFDAMTVEIDRIKAAHPKP